MRETTFKESFNKKCLRIAFLILSSLFISGYVISRQQWNKSYFDIIHSIADNYIEIEFKFFDYVFGPAGENGYLKECYLQYSTDSVNYKDFIKVNTKDQRHIGNWTWMLMSEKLPGAKIQFGRCNVPGAGKIWEEGTNYYRVEVCNSDAGNTAWFNFIWHLEDKYQDIKFIRLYAIWNVNGIYSNDLIVGVVYKIFKFIISESKTPETMVSAQKNVNIPIIIQPGNNEIQVSKDVDAIVVKGVPGQNIKVYTPSGVLIQSIIANRDVVKIKLSTNQIYIVHIGQVRHIVSL